MCLIIHQPAGATTPVALLQSAAEYNPDGFGFMGFDSHDRPRIERSPNADVALATRLAEQCVIRAKPVQDSALCRSIIPRDVGPRFRGKPVQRVRRDNPATLDPFSLLGGGRGGAAEVIRAQDSRGTSSPV